MALMLENKIDKPKNQQSRGELIKKAIKKSFGKLTGTYYDDLVDKYKLAETTDVRYSSKSEKTGVHGGFNAVFGYNENDDAQKNLFEREYAEQRKVFRQLAKQPTIMEIIETITKEAIIDSDDGELFANIDINKNALVGLNLKNEFVEDFHELVDKVFMDIMTKLGFLDTEVAQGKMMDFVVDGKLAFEIVYNADDITRATDILQILPLDPLSIRIEAQGNGVVHYIQTNEAGNDRHPVRNKMLGNRETTEERILLDHNIIYIDFSESTSAISRTSFIERLIKPYNMYRVLEQSKLIWYLAHSIPNMKYKVPIKGQNTQDMEATLATTMQTFHEQISFDSSTGELTINGSQEIPFVREMWAISSEAGDFDMEMVEHKGQDLSDFDDLMVWIRRLYRVANVPMTRYDLDGNETWIGNDTQSMSQQERRFQNMLKTFRKKFSEIILKPLRIKLLLLNPSLYLDEELIRSIRLIYQRYDEFEKMIKQEKFSNSIDLIERAKNSLVDQDQEGNETKWFSNQFLIEEYLELTPRKIKRNLELKRKEDEEREEAYRRKMELEKEYEDDE